MGFVQSGSATTIATTDTYINGNYNNNRQKQRNNNIKDILGQLKWCNIILITAIHSIFVWGVFAFPWTQRKRLVLWNFILGIISGFGVTGGAHRFWCHRSFKAKLPLRIILMLSYCVAGHNPLFNWIRDHRVHHKFTETDADPHNSKKGFFFSHVGWLMLKKHPEVVRRGKEVDMSDIWEDPVIRFHQKYYLILVLTLGFIIPTIIPPLCWGDDWQWSILAGCIGRYVITLNCTWLVNSAAHIWGRKPYDNFISPTENLMVSICALGEGWHNYHHVFPWDYKTAELGKYGVNVTAFFIDMFAKIDWAYDLKVASPKLIRNAVRRRGDGTHPIWNYIMEYDDNNSDYSLH